MPRLQGLCERIQAYMMSDEVAAVGAEEVEAACAVQ